MPIPGTIQSGLPFAPGSTGAQSYIVESAFLKGSLRSVNTYGERDYLVTALGVRGETGMIVHVNSDGKYWKLSIHNPGGNTGTWTEVISNAGSILPVASSSVTGVASFNTPDFVIGSTGHVTLSSVFTRGSTFNGDVSIGGRLTASNLFVSHGATFGRVSASNIVNSILVDDVITGFTGNITLKSGSNISLSTVGNDITINSNAVANIPVASTSVTGVASFNSSDFVVSAAGAVSLTDVFTGGATFTAAVSVGGSLTAQGLYVSQGATFASQARFVAGLSSGGTVAVQNLSVDGGATFNTVNATTYRNLPQASDSVTGVASFNSTYFTVASAGQVSLASAYQVTGDTIVAGTNIGTSRSGRTVTVSSTHPIASASATGVASFDSSDFVVSAAGAVSLTDVFTGGATFTAAVSVGGSLTAQSLYVSQGATFASRARFDAGLSSGGTIAAQSLSVDAGATFAARATFSAGLTSLGTVAAQSLSVDAGATFASQARFVAGLSSGGTVAVQSLSVDAGATFNTVSATTYRGLPVATADGASGVASFRTSDFTVSATGNVRLAQDIVRSLNGLTGTPSVASSDGSVVVTTSGSNVDLSARIATKDITGVARFPDNDEFTVNPSGDVNLSSTVAKTNKANQTFTTRQTFTVGITTGQLYVGGGATFASGIQGLNSALSVNNNRITDLAAPSAASDAATRAYVDSIAAGLNYHPNVKAATVTVLPHSPVYFNGPTASTPGVEATLFANNNGVTLGSIDNVDILVGNRILVKDQATKTQNGIYVVTRVGSAGTTGWMLTRASDADNSITGQVAGGDTVYVEAGGTTNGGAGFVLIGQSNVGKILGTDEIVWTQYTGVDTSQAGDGLGKSGNSFNVLVDNSTIEIVSDQLRLKNSSNYALKDTANTFTPLQTFNGGITTQSLYVSQGATFASRARFDAGLSSGGTIAAQSLSVDAGATFASRATFSAGLTSLGTVVAQSLSVDAGATFASLARFVSGMSSGGTIAAHSLSVDNGATFAARARFVAGLSSGGTIAAQSLSVDAGATFTSRATFSAGLTSLGTVAAHSLSVDLGATFGSLASFVRGMSSAGIYVSAGSTFTGLVEMLGNLTAANLYVSGGATFNSRTSFLSGLTAGGYTRLNELGVLAGATFASNVYVVGRLQVDGDFYARNNAYVGEIAGGGTSGTLSATGGDVIWLPTGQLIKTFNHATTGNASLTHASGSVTVVDELGNVRSVTCGYADLVVTVESGTGNNYSGGGKYTCRFNIATEGNTVNWNQYGAVSTGGLIANFDVVAGNGGAWHLIATPVGRSATNPAVFRTYAIMTPSEGVFRVGNDGFNSPGGNEGGPPPPPPIWNSAANLGSNV